MGEPVPSLTIEILGEDRPWEVTFEDVSPRTGHDGPAFRVRAIADSGRYHHSVWYIDAGFARSLGEQEASDDSGLLRGVIHYYRHHFDEIITTDGTPRHLGLTERAYFLPASGTYLDRVEHEIADILFDLARMMTTSDTAILATSPLIIDLPAPEEWPRARTRLRQAAEPAMQDVHADCQAFYDAYREQASQGEFMPSQALSRSNAMRELNALGSEALRSIASARRQGSTQAASRSRHQDKPWPGNQPVHLSALHLRNLRRFDDLAVEFQPPADATRGQWIVLLGDNGTGKTTILRALALALLPDDVASAHVTQSSADAPFIRRPVANGQYARIHAALGSTATDPPTANITEVALTPDSGRERFSVERPLTRRPPVFGYGCRRGSALGGPMREADPRPLDGTATIFDENAALIHAETWLKDWELEANGNTEQSGFVEAVKKTLLGLFPGRHDGSAIFTELIVKRDRVSVRGPDIDDVPLAALSDGYLTTLGWTIDLIARWAEYARSAGYPLDKSFRETMPCVVLIDELDLHLHPRWQRDIIAKLRDAFPMTTFIATTHNPLTLLGTQEGEVHVIRERDDGELDVIQRDLPQGIRADQVLSGEWFGLRSTVDDETIALLDAHRAMLLERVPGDAPERLELESRLRRRLGRFAETPAQQLAEEIVAQHHARYDRPVTDADRAALQKLYADSVRRAGSRSDGSTGQDEP